MTKTIKLALVAAMAMGSTSAFATNGDNLIATGAKARGMGGVGIAKAFGSQSSLANPALLNSVKKSEVSGSVTMFMPDVETGSNAASNSQTGTVNPIVTQASDADQSFIPEISYATRIDEKMVVGFSLTGTAGMGVDYDDAAFGTPADNGVFRMKTELALLKVAVPFSYQVDNSLTLGVAPILQYGTLQMSHIIDTSAPGTPPVPADFVLLDNGASSDTSLGFELGVAYDMKEVGVEGLTLGAVYKSELAMTYDDTISSSIAAFGLSPAALAPGATAITSGDDLAQPAEFGIGASYTMGENTVSLDYKNVAWGSAAGYSDFGWEDQDIVAIGYEYAAPQWALRVGYNHASSPIAEQDGGTYTGAVQNFFNQAGFPGIVESHFTIGGSFDVSDALALDISAVYADEVSDSFDTSAMTAAFQQGAGGAPTGTPSSIETTHSQFGLSIGATYKF